MRHVLAIAVVCVGLGLNSWAGASMDDDPEAQALLKVLGEMTVNGTYLDDTLDGTAKGKITGPVTFGPGLEAEEREADKALVFPDDRVNEVYVYYGPYVPLRGKFSLDFRADEVPRDHNFMTVFSIGTAGNNCMTVRLGLDLRVTVSISTKRERVRTFSDPVSQGEWHHLEIWYGPEGSALVVDGAIEDFSLDWSVPYSHNRSMAFYLGDQPWWDARNRKGIFYPLDGFVGRIDNLRLERLQPEGTQ